RPDCGGTVRTRGPPESALHALGRRAGRAHFAAVRPRHRVEAESQRKQDLHAGIGLRLSAARVHGAAARPGHRHAVRRAQSPAAPILLSQAVLPRRADQLLRARRTRDVMSSLDRILPFLRPIEDLLRDPGVTEVMVNAGGARVFIERNGRLEFVPGRVLEARNLPGAIKNIARAW